MSQRNATILIFALAVLVRAILLCNVPLPAIVYERPMVDGYARSWDEGINVGFSLAQKGEFADPFGRPSGLSAHVPPAFPLTVAAISRVFGYSLKAALVRDALIIATFALLYASLPAAASALGLNANAGIIAGFLGAIFPIFRSCEVFRGRDECLAALALLWLTVLAFRVFASSPLRLRDTALFGIGWGALLLIQPATLLVFAGHLIVWMLAAVRRDSIRRDAGYALLVVAFALIPLTPWAVRNYRVFREWFFVRDNAGLELRLSFGENAKATLTGNLEDGPYPLLHPSFSDSALLQVRELGEIGFNRKMRNEALAFIEMHPGKAAKLVVARFCLFWTDWPYTPVTFLERTVLSVLAWIGIALIWRSGRRLAAQLLGAVLVFYPLTYYIDQYSPRYVIAICFAVLLPAGYAVAAAFPRIALARPEFDWLSFADGRRRRAGD